MQAITILIAALALLTPAGAHMSLQYPAPLRAAINANVPQSAVDYTPTAPLSGAAQFPCKGYQSDMGSAQGKATANWSAGSQQNFTVLGSAVHGGGSCQAALSYDKGVSWKVIHTYLGSCPLKDGQSFDFTVPSDAPATGSDGTIFAWLWYNMIGNREIYMSCASVNVAAGSSTRSAPAVAYSSRPDLFVANLANGCLTVEGKEVQIPNPGPAADVTNQYTVASDSGSFTGTCAAVNGIGGGSGSSNNAAPAAPGASSSASSVSSIVTSSVQPSTLSTTTSSASSVSIYTIPGFEPTPSGVFATVNSSAPTGSASPSSSVSPVETPASSSVSGASPPLGTGSSSGLTISSDGSCGPGVATCGTGMCCSSYGFCGNTNAYCASGCQEGFGQCGSFLNSTSSAPIGAKFRIRV